jgi:hypothetical protein
MMAPVSLLMLPLNKGLQCLQFFEDSLLVMKWMKQEQHIHNVSLQPLVDWIWKNSQFFDQITFTHVYRELNYEVNALSKAYL